MMKEGREMKKGNLVGAMLFVVMLLSALLTGCGGSPEPKKVEGPKKMRLAWVVAQQEDHPYTVAAVTFANVAKEKTKGKMTALRMLIGINFILSLLHLITLL